MSKELRQQDLKALAELLRDIANDLMDGGLEEWESLDDCVQATKRNLDIDCREKFELLSPVVKKRVAKKRLSKANQTQVAGAHYKDQNIQPWDFIAANNIGFFEGNIVKYIARHKDKGGVVDLQKARHYLDKLIELTVK